MTHLPSSRAPLLRIDIALRRLRDDFGLNWRTRSERLRYDTILTRRFGFVRVTRTNQTTSSHASVGLVG